MAKRGRKARYDLSEEACPNPKCSLYGKPGEGNIVSNGSHGGEGKRTRKFLCRECGGSFCERTGTIFYDLRSPREKVLMALKLLVKGMPLRGVAEVMEDLGVRTAHSLEVNESLLRELKVSQVELDALWSFVKKNDLKQRAHLWKEKSGLASLLPRSLG